MGILRGFWHFLGDTFSVAPKTLPVRRDVIQGGLCALLMGLASQGEAQTVGSQYKVTRIGRDVLGGQGYAQSQDIMALSPDGRYATGVRFGSSTRGFLMTTGTPVLLDIPKVASSHPYAHGKDVNDEGDVVGYEKWSAGNVVNIIPWFYDRSAGTVTSLYSSSNPTLTAIPTAITIGSTYAFGMADTDGPLGATPSQGVYWNLSTRARTSIPGVREVLDASADGSILLVVDSSTGYGKVLRGSVATGWTTTVASFGFISGGKVSPDGRYVATSEIENDYLLGPFVFDTVQGLRMNLPLRAGDTLGGKVGAVSDTGRVLGSVHTAGSNGSFAVMWLSPLSSYTTFLDLLATDGHASQDSTYYGWNLYNGGDGISADGMTMAIYGRNLSALEDSMLFQQNCPAITLNPASLPAGSLGAFYTQTLTASGGSGSNLYSIASGSLPAGLALNASTGVLSGTRSSPASASFTVRVMDASGCMGQRSYTINALCTPIAISPAVPANAIINVIYSQSFTATGGSSSYTWTVTGGSLPPGLTLNPSTGAVGGKATSANGEGVEVTLTATDSIGCSGSQTVRLVVCPVITLAPSSLASGTLGTNYSATVTASSGTPPYAFSVSSGSLPAGLVLNEETGAISGLPTTAGTSSVTLRAVDASGCSGTRAYSFTINAATSDFGDYSLFGNASSTVNTTLRIGTLVDAEGSTIADNIASGDDTFGSDDEDGVTFSSLVQGKAGTATVRVTNTRGTTSYLNMWMDWNGDGTLSSTEQVATNLSIANGTNNVNRAINFTVPAAALEGMIGVRVRLTSTTSPGSASASGIGEVEDHLVSVTSACPEFAVVVVNYNNNTISRFSGTDGSHLATWTPSGLSSPNYGYRVSDNTLLVANGSSNTVTKHNPFTGALISTLVPAGRGLNFPYQMAVALDSSIYIANQNAGNVLRFNQTTGEVLGTVLSTSSPAGLVFDEEGKLYITQNVSGGSLRQYNSSGTLLSVITTWPSGEYPRGLAWGPDGRLYVNVRNNNSSNGRVDAISLPGGTRSTFVTLDSGSNPYTGIKWGPDSNLYVVDYGENELDVFSASGSLLRKLTTSLDGPHAVAFSDCEASTQDFGDYVGFGDASSTWSTTVRLGNEVDTESRPRSNLYANGDDIDDIDDEDGVTMPASFTAGSTVTVPVKLLNTSGGTVYLNAWLDADLDGDLTDAGEQVITNRTVANGSNGVTQNISITVPAGVTPGMAGMRFRLSTVSSVAPTGSAGIGEVEDYLVALLAAPVDFGDLSVLGSASSVVNAGLRIGTNATDSETANPANATATGDDAVGTDDEDSALPAFASGASSSVPLNLFNNTGATAYFSAWVDWNNDGALNGSNEQVIAETTVTTSSSVQSRTFTVNVPGTAVRGTPLGLRLRLSSLPGIPSIGSHGLGEVEDYQITVQCPSITVNPVTVASAVTGASYTQTFTASGGTAPYTFAVSAGALPVWATLNADSGVLTGIPNSATTASFTIRATDASGCMGSRAYSLTPSCPALTVSTSTLPAASVGTFYDQMLAAAGGTGPYTWDITSGTLPAGMSLVPATGRLSGSPTTGNGAGASLVFRATDANGCQVSRTLVLRVCPVINLSPSTLPAPVLGAAYDQTVTASSGAAPYLYAVGTGSLPAGLTLNVSTGKITGVATSLAPASLTLTATDTNGCRGTRAYVLTPVCPTLTVTPGSLPAAAVGVEYNQTLTVTNGTAPYSWAVSAGTLPAGLTLNADSGVLSGLPTADNGAGAAITFRATDANGCLGTVSMTFKVCPVITISPAILAPVVVGSPYSQTLTASGGASGYTYALVSGALPSGLNLSAEGVISGSTTVTAPASIVVAVTDGNGCVATKNYSVAVGCSPVSIAPTTLSPGMAGTSYSQTLTSDLPSGLKGEYFLGMNFETLALTRQDAAVNFAWGGGSPDPVISVDGFSVRWTGAVMPPSTGSYAFRATADDGVRLWVNNVLVIDRWIDQGATAYTATVNLTGGVPVNVRMEYYERGGDAVAALDWSGPSFAMKSVTEWTSYQWTVASGSLPAGLSLNATTGVISGILANSSTATFTVRAVDWKGCEGTRAYTLNAGCSTVTVNPETLASATVGTPYSQALTALPVIGLTGEYYSGLNFNTLLLTRKDAAIDFDWGNDSPHPLLPNNVFSVRWTGKLMPPSTGSYTFRTTSDDGIRLWVNNVLVIDQWRDQSPTNYAAAVNLTGGAEVPVKVEFYENGGGAVARLYWSGPGFASKAVTEWQTYTWAVASGSLPSGLSLNTATGVISGTPTSNVTSNFIIRASDSSGCAGTRAYTLGPVCPPLAITTSSLPDAYLGVAYNQVLAASGASSTLTWTLSSGSLPTGLNLSPGGVISGTPSLTGSASFTVRAVDMAGCQVTRSFAMSARSLALGNQVWADMNNDGLRQTGESGIAGLRMELWSVGNDGVRNNGGGDDAKAAVDVFTDANGLYQFTLLVPGSYYVRMPTAPLHFPAVSTGGVNLDNGVNNDSNAIQPAGSGTQVVSPVIVLTPTGEPDTAADGDGPDTDSTVDFGFANLDACYVSNLIDNPSFEFQQQLNSTGTALSVQGYNGAGTGLGTGINAYQWVNGINGSSGLGEPVQRVQIQAAGSGSRVSWVESFKSRHGSRHMLLQGTSSGVSVRAAGGTGWGTVLQAGREYQLSVWAANASAADASIIWNLGANAPVFQVITGSTPGIYQQYTVSQAEMTASAVGELQCCGFPVTGTSLSKFTSADYNSWSEAVANGAQPQWRQFTWRFRVAAGATASQLDTANFVLSGGSSSGPVVADFVSLCQLSSANNLAIGNQVWTDANNNGFKDGNELGRSGVTVQLYSSVDLTAGNADDVFISSSTTSTTGNFQFSNLAEGRYVLKVTPPSSLPLTGGTPVALDNQVNNDNNGSQPGGQGTALFSPVVTLTSGLEPVNDGDDSADSDLSVDFGLFSGITVGNQVWADTNNDGVYDSTAELGISGLTVQLLNQADEVVATTTTNGSGVYSLLAYRPGIYHLRIPTPSSTYPLASPVADQNDNGEDNDSNGLQPGGVGTAVFSPEFTLTAATEPGSAGSTNTENTLDFGFRACPSIVVNPGVLGAATRNITYSVNLSATGGSTPYNYALSMGSLPEGLTLSPAGLLSGAVSSGAFLGDYSFVVRATDATGCFGVRSYILKVTQGVIAISPETLPSATQYLPYTQNLVASGGSAPYAWSVSPAVPSGVLAWWPAEASSGTIIGTDAGSALSGTSYGTGRIGKAFVFDGVDDVVAVADSETLRPALLTLEAWVNPTYPMNANGSVISKTTSALGTDGYGLGQLGADNTFGFWLNNRSSNRVTTTLTAGVWQHVVATFDGSQMRIYVNGVLQASSSFAGSITHSSTSLLIGGGASDGAWKGGVDEVLIYGRALSLAEIQARYQATLTGNQGLPQGLGVDATTGALAGTPTSPPGNYTFHVRASDSSGTIGGRAYQLTVTCGTLAIAPVTLPAATRLVAYPNQTLTATGGTAPYTWSLSSGSLPTGLSLSPAGVISGTTTANAGTTNLTVSVVDAAGCVGARSYNFTVQCAALTISPSVLPAAQQFAAYPAQTITAAGGTGPYRFSISTGSLPAGMALSADGSLSGTPAAVPGNYTVVLRATDNVGCTSTRAYVLTVTCPSIVISPASLPAAGQGAAYNQTLTATNGNSPYSWAVTAGALPPGMVISPSGQLSGTVTASSGSYSFTITATDGRSCVATRSYTVPVACPVLQVAPASLPTGTANVAYSQMLTATGGTAPYTWVLAGGTLPAGVTLAADGTLAGTPAAGSSGSYTFTVRITDSGACVQETNLTLAISCPVITMSPSALPPGTVAAPYDTTLTATGSSGSYTWSVVNGSLPQGLQLVLGDNKIVGSGTAYASIFSPAGSVTVDPSNGNLLSLVLGGTAGPVDVGFWNLKANGGMSIVLPGLGLTESGSRVSLDDSALKFQVSNNASSLLGWLGVGTAINSSWEATATFNKPDAPIELQPNTRYTVSFLVDGSNGLLQSGLGISPTFTLELLDGAGNAISSQSSGTLVNLLGLLGTGVTSGTVNLTFITPGTVGAGAAKLRIKASAALNTTVLGLGTTFASIRNLQVISTNGSTSPQAKIIGTPLCGNNSQSFTLKATDASGCAAVANYSIPVTCSPVSIVTTTLQDAAVGQSYLQVLEASGGLAPYTWTVAAGALPPGVSLSASGSLSGVPSASVDSSFTARVTDSCGCSTTRAFVIRSTCPTITVTPETLPAAYLETSYTQTLTATGGSGPYLWVIESGSLPAGLNLTPTGTIQGKATTSTTALFTVNVTDSYGCSTLRAYSLAARGLSVGNLVFNDVNLNGIRDGGEPGIAGASMQLWSAGADRAIGGSGLNADAQVGTTLTTPASGAYAFNGLAPGYYYVRLVPPVTSPLSGGSPVALDNGIDHDNNAASQPGGAGTTIFSPVVQLGIGTEPTVDDGDADTDFTLDFGLFRGMGLGNLVFQDTNDNGLRDDGEPGLDGVTLELWAVGADGVIGGTDDVRMRTMVTAGGGQYAFSSLAPGKYYVRIPTPPLSHPLSSSSTVLADNRVDNDDNGHQPAGGSLYSPVVTLSPGSESSDSGYTDSTLDFGLCNVLPTAYVSATQDDSIQVYDPNARRFQGNFHHPFGSSHNQGDGNPFDVPYSIEMGPDGNWYVAHFGASNLRKISPAGVDLGAVLVNTTANVSFIEAFAIGPDGNFYVVDLNGHRIVKFQGPLAASPGMPMGTAPHTFISQAGIQDVNFGPDGNLYAVILDSAVREVRRYSSTTGSLLNVIVTDTQLVNMVPGGEPVSIISGIDIHGSTLYGANRLDDEIFKVDLTQPGSPGEPQLVATMTAAGAGSVEARDIEMNPGTGKLYVAGYNWAKPVLGGTFATGAVVEIDPAGAPNGTVHIFEAPIPSPPGPNNEIWSGPRDLAFGRPFVQLPDSVSVGSLVWNDLNANGRRDAGERGIPGVRVELWRDLDGETANGAEFRMGWTFTDERGVYYFSGQTPGRYQLKIPALNFGQGLPLAGSGFSSPITSINDDQTDNDDNGQQPGGNFTEVLSPIITLTPGTEPLGNAQTGAEIGSGGEVDDYTVDANGDMTVDFGFVEPGVMGIGNLVFNDLNGSRRFDLGEGMDNAVVQLYYWGQTPGVDQPLATTLTANGGKYLFTGLWQAQYFVHLPALQFQSTGVLRGLFSLEGVQAGDDDQGEDSVDNLQPTVEGISSGRIILTRDSAPTNASSETGFDATDDDADDANTDLTADFGLFRPVALGNLVFADGNSNGRYDPGEGLNGITLQLYNSGQIPGTDAPLATRVSANGGRYLFDFIRPGNYIVHVPAAMFAQTGPLYQQVSINEGLAGDDNVGEDGVNEGAPAANGVSTAEVRLFPGAAPTDSSGETGLDGTSDNDNDSAVDLTVDFGFQTPVGVGNLVFLDNNANGVADAGEGVDGVRVEIYRSTQTPGTTTPLAQAITEDGGRYFFDFLSSGTYIVHIPASEFAAGRPLYNTLSVQGSQTGSADDSSGEDGVDEATPALNGVSTRLLFLAVNACPTNGTTETGLHAQDDDFDDNNFDLTVDFGFAVTNPNAVGVGNLVFQDANANGVYDSGEGVNGVRVELFASTADPQTASPLASAVTTNEGIYFFGNLAAGAYLLHIPASEFAEGKPLYGWTSMPGQGLDSGIDDDSDENGGDTDPVSLGITSTVIELQPGNEPENFLGEFGRDAFMDDANDANMDLTVDFGFSKLASVGNLVFLDSNNNGTADEAEGLPGVEVQLYEEDASTIFDEPVAITTTDANGRYLFTDVMPGNYYLHVPYYMFMEEGPLHLQASVYGTSIGDDNLGEDGLDDGRPDSNGISTAVFSLSPSASPVGAAEGGQDGGSDDLTDAGVDLTRDFGFVPSVEIGNLVFSDANSDGIFDPDTESGLSGVSVELWSNEAGAASPLATVFSSSLGVYSFRIAPGTYHLRVDASQFSSGGQLENLVPSVATQNGAGTFVDDNVGQDIYEFGNVTVVGARTAAFSVQTGEGPTETNGETGYGAFEDDLSDQDSDLTVDLGFAPKPLRVGNLVFADVNGDGRFSATTDFGIPGVLVQLFTIGDIPQTSTPLAETYTGSDGGYELKAPGAGSYFVHIPATQFGAGKPLSGASAVLGFGSDDGTDDSGNEDTLDQPQPATTGISSTLFDLDFGTEPTDELETGFKSNQDVGYDADADLTIDLGFLNVPVPANLGVGNVVFKDANANGRYDANEGVSGVWMLLYRSGDVPGLSTPYASTFTDAAGRYLFSSLPPGGYIVHVAADNFKPNLTSLGGNALPGLQPGPLFNLVSVTGETEGDDLLGENGVDALAPAISGISSQVVILQPDQSPVGSAENGFDGSSDNEFDGDFDLTVDFGFAEPDNGSGTDPDGLQIGNLVFKDANGNGRHEAGEGVSGVIVQLYRSTDIPAVSLPVAITTTASNGRYLFSRLTAGNYIVHIPALNFAPGVLGLTVEGPLHRHRSITGYQTQVLDDHLGEDGVDALLPEVTGVSSTLISLQAGAAPVGTVEGGFDGSSDDAYDADSNLTVDFGFVAMAVEPLPEDLGIGNVIFKDANTNGHYDAGEGIAGVAVQLYRNTDVPGISAALKTVVTDSSGRYAFAGLASGIYVVHIAAENFRPGVDGFVTAGPLFNCISVAGHQTSSGDDNQGEDGVDSVTPLVTGISSLGINLQVGTAPAGAAEGGFDSSSDDAKDADTNLTVDFGFVPFVAAEDLSLGNLVFKDLNTNGRYDAGEGAAGVTVHLYRSTDVLGLAVPVKTTTTDNAGRYLFGGLYSGSYYVHIPAENFRAPILAAISAGPLYNHLSVNGHQAGMQDDNLGEDGVDAPAPFITGISSGIISLQPGQSPTGAAEGGFEGTADDAKDADGNLTVDFGFVDVTPVPENLAIGNVVFKDANRNGRYDVGEGTPGVKVQLYRSTDLVGVIAPLKTVTTDAAGRYLFSGLQAGSYFVHIPAQNFGIGVAGVIAEGALYNHLSIASHQAGAGDDDLGEDGVDSLLPLVTGISSEVIVLQVGTAPVGAAESGFDGSTDDARDADSNLTVDFGFVPVIAPPDTGLPGLGIGNVVFMDANGNGRYNAGEGVAGVTVYLYRSADLLALLGPLKTTTTDSAGRYLFSDLAANSYVVHIPAANFQAGLLGIITEGPLFKASSLPGYQTASGDDNTGEDGMDVLNLTLLGISSRAITLQSGTAPTGSAEGGFEGTSDDDSDADYDLTVDFGFKVSGGLLGLGLTPPPQPAAPAPVAVPASSTWQSLAKTLGEPTADLDADGAANLLEYALDTDAASGLQTQRFFLQTDAVTGRVDALVIRPSGGRVDVRHQLETRGDLRLGEWSPVTVVPVISQNNNGSETLRYADVAALGEMGFLRLKVTLDADLNGNAEATVVSGIQAWVRRDISGQQSFSMPLLRTDVFNGIRTAGVKSKLVAGQSYYVEVLSGANEGQRYELDEEATTDGALAFETATPDLASTRLAVRPHWTVNGLFPADAFATGTEAANADRLLFFDPASGSFRTSWLSANGWTGDSAGDRIVASGEGLLVHARTGTVSLTFIGAVRSTQFAQPLQAGAQFIGSGFPVAHTVQTLGLRTEAGFAASTTPEEATRLRLWKGDVTPGDHTYRHLYLHNPASLWMDEADGSDASTQTLLEPTRAFFLVTPVAVPGYQEP
ncbi:MAG: SdrD B-like domain-containing protein [Verrucomicrobiota bacterium]